MADNQLEPGRWLSEYGKEDADSESDPRDLRILRAAKHGWEDLARSLLQDTDPEPFPMNSARRDGHTALSLASQNGHEGIVRLLLSHGAEVGIHNANDGPWLKSLATHTPIYFAAINNHAGVVRILIEAGANVDGGEERGGHNQPVSYAARLGYEEVVRVLLENGAPAEFREEKCKPSMCWAAEDGLDSIINLLIEYGADVNYPDYGGMTPLSFAAKEGKLHTVKILLAHGADIHAVDNQHASTPWIPSRGGQTALSKASWNGHADVIRYLLEQGADSNRFDFSNNCPLVHAARGGHFDAVRVFLEHDPKPSVAGPEGLTALQVALRQFKALDPGPREWYDAMWELLEPASTRHTPGTLETLFGFKLW